MRAADPLMAKLHSIAFNDKMPPQVQLEAIKHALKVTGAFESKQSIELDIVGTSKRSFEDVSADVVMDLSMGDEDIFDAEIVEDHDPADDASRWEREDAARERAAERSRMVDPRRALHPAAATSAKQSRRDREEAAALAQAGKVTTWVEDTAENPRSYDSEAGLTREQLLIRRGASGDDTERRATPPKRWASRHGRRD